jgi:hypothetical protein
MKDYNSSDPARPLVLWQNADTDVRGQCVDDKRENLSGVNPVRTHCLSDEVLNYTKTALNETSAQHWGSITPGQITHRHDVMPPRDDCLTMCEQI